MASELLSTCVNVLVVLVAVCWLISKLNNR